MSTRRPRPLWDARDASGRAIPFVLEVGDVVGKLTVVAKDSFSTALSTHTRVLCRCECGAEVRPMRTATLLQRARRGKPMACKQCRAAYRTAWQREALLDLWEQTGSLYSGIGEWYDQQQFMEEMVRRFGPLRDDAPRNQHPDWPWAPPPAYYPSHARQWLDDEERDAAEQASKDRAYADAMMLVRGEEPAVEKAERDEDGMSLQEIGDAFGLTRERIRQIETGALAKLRKHPLLLQAIDPDWWEREAHRVAVLAEEKRRRQQEHDDEAPARELAKKPIPDRITTASGTHIIVGQHRRVGGKLAVLYTTRCGHVVPPGAFDPREPNCETCHRMEPDRMVIELNGKRALIEPSLHDAGFRVGLTGRIIYVPELDARVYVPQKRKRGRPRKWPYRTDPLSGKGSKQ